jgi:hypothetical protein
MRSFEFFRARVAREISSYFDAKFWNQMVMQAGMAEPTVRHAILALSSLYEAGAMSLSVHQPSSSDRRRYLTGFAIRHYTKAVALLYNRISLTAPSLEVILISCLIFIWLEFLQDNVDTALNHLQGGIRILAEQQYLAGSPTLVKQLARYFTRLHVQASLHGSVTTEFDYNTIIGSTELPVNGPLNFSTIQDARINLDSKMYAVFRFHRRIEKPGFVEAQMRQHPFPDPQSLECMSQSHIASLQEWNTAFQALSTSLSPTSKLHAEELQALHQLELQYLLVSNTLQTLFITTPLVFDNYDADYARMVDLSQQILRHQTHRRASFSPPTTHPIAACTATRTNTLPFDTTIQGPLLYVVLKCRRLPVRRAAVALLRQCPAHEGIWQRDSLVALCEWKIATEERRRPPGASEEEVLPEAARIYAEKAREAVVDGRRVTVVRYKRGASRGIADGAADEEEVTGLSMRLAGLIGT